jgi:predicted nucleic acid-binding protein
VSACLDAYAILCWLQDEPGAELVERHLTAGARDLGSRCPMSVINLGEVFYRLGRTRGLAEAEAFWEDVRRGEVPVRVVESTRKRVREAAALKARYPIAYADAFAIQLALERGLPLLTGDPEIKSVEGKEPLELHWLGPGPEDAD